MQAFGQNNKDPFMFKDDKMILAMGSSVIPPDKQEPSVDQFNLGIENERKGLIELFRKCFKKQVIIWMLEKNWSKAGDMVVAVFYSNILGISTSSSKLQEVTVGSIKSERKDIKMDKKDDKMFDEFVEYMKVLNSSSNPDEE